MGRIDLMGRERNSGLLHKESSMRRGMHGLGPGWGPIRLSAAILLIAVGVALTSAADAAEGAREDVAGRIAARMEVVPRDTKEIHSVSNDESLKAEHLRRLAQFEKKQPYRDQPEK
jgi:hypothetical protein